MSKENKSTITNEMHDEVRGLVCQMLDPFTEYLKSLGGRGVAPYEIDYVLSSVVLSVVGHTGHMLQAVLQVIERQGRSETDLEFLRDEFARTLKTMITELIPNEYPEPVFDRFSALLREDLEDITEGLNKGYAREGL